MGRVLSGAGAALRQWRHPREFRIHASAWPADALTALTELAPAELARGGATQTGTDTMPAGASGPDGLSGRSLADVATSVWRLRARMERMDDAPRAVLRHLETAWDALADAGVEIKDHAGDPFDPGLAMSVVAYQPTPGLRREQIIETVRPGVYLGGHSIQMAEVIVGTPDPPDTDPSPADPGSPRSRPAGAEETRTR
jgi:hypothetical protein